jgi:hypothetical protein
VYIWVIRKRADRAYQAYLIAFNKEVLRLDNALSVQRLAAARKQELEKSLALVKRQKVTHFDFIEDVVAYHIMKVGQRDAYPHVSSVLRATVTWCNLTVCRSIAPLRPPDLQISSTRQWWVVLELGPLTNAIRGKKKNSHPVADALLGAQARAALRLADLRQGAVHDALPRTQGGNGGGRQLLLAAPLFVRE